MHSHTPFVFVSLGTALMALTLQDGSNVTLDTYPGQVMWIEDEVPMPGRFSPEKPPSSPWR